MADNSQGLPYRQTQNECAGAAVAHALRWPHGINAIELADDACLIDAFPGNNTREGGTSIEACLTIAQRRGWCSGFFNAGAAEQLLREHLAAGGRACMSIDSGVVNPSNGRLMAHAVCILEWGENLPTHVGIYDPAHGCLLLCDDSWIRAQVRQPHRGYWLVATNVHPGVVHRIMAKAKTKRLILKLLAGAVVVGLAVMWWIGGGV